MLGQHFTSHLGLASGVAHAGTGLGQTVMAPVIRLLLDTFALDTVILVFALAFLSALPLCLLFKSVKRTEEDGTDTQADDRGTVRRMVSVMVTPSKLLLVLHVFVLNIGVYSVFTYFPERAVSFGQSKDQAAMLVSIMGFANFSSRILSGVLIDRFRGKIFLLLTSIHLVNGASILASQFLTSFPVQALAAAIFGAGFGAKVQHSVRESHDHDCRIFYRSFD